MDVDHRIGVIDFACFWGWEHPRIAGMLLVLCDQQINGILRDGDFSDRVFRFRSGNVRFPRVVSSSQLFQWNISDARRDMQFDAAPVVFGSRESQMWLRIEFIPRLQPCAERIFVQPTSVKRFRFGDRSGELLFHFCLCLAENALDDSLACLFIISGCVSPLPAPVLPFSNVAFTVCPFLCHVCASFPSVAQTTTTEPAQSLLIFSEDRNIFTQFHTYQKSLFFVYCGAVFDSDK